MSLSSPSTTGYVTVDDCVEDAVKDRRWTKREQVGIGLEAMAYGGQRSGRPVSYDNDEGHPEQDEDLAEFDLLLLVEIARRLQHDEERIVVHVELWPLMRREGVLDSELVEVELRRRISELLLGRFVEPEPHETVAGFGLTT